MEKISRAERARQFMPFAALRGFEELIREQTREKMPRRELSEYEAELLSQKMSGVEKGDMVSVTYYDTDAYVTAQGMVSEVDFSLRFLRVIKRQIKLDDITDIEIMI